MMILAAIALAIGAQVLRMVLTENMDTVGPFLVSTAARLLPRDARAEQTREWLSHDKGLAAKPATRLVNGMWLFVAAVRIAPPVVAMRRALQRKFTKIHSASGQSYMCCLEMLGYKCVSWDGDGWIMHGSRTIAVPHTPGRKLSRKLAVRIHGATKVDHEKFMHAFKRRQSADAWSVDWSAEPPW